MGLSVRVVYFDCAQRSVCTPQKRQNHLSLPEVNKLIQVCDMTMRTRQYSDKSVGNAISTEPIWSKGLSTASN